MESEKRIPNTEVLRALKPYIPEEVVTTSGGSNEAPSLLYRSMAFLFHATSILLLMVFGDNNPAHDTRHSRPQEICTVTLVALMLIAEATKLFQASSGAPISGLGALLTNSQVGDTYM